ncbi:MAG: DUF1294 domain-containing protein [Oscillospiraceae bacterium]|nr:DUF1294 domain-containing protein [Oscillospiraceae bacterium]
MILELGILAKVILAYLLIVNFVAFILMGDDKRRAKKQGVRRIPEKTLFLSAILGGSVGAIAGMQVFHHKTKHWYFVWGMPLILLVQVALIIWLIL